MPTTDVPQGDPPTPNHPASLRAKVPSHKSPSTTTLHSEASWSCRRSSGKSVRRKRCDCWRRGGNGRHTDGGWQHLVVAIKWDRLRATAFQTVKCISFCDWFFRPDIRKPLSFVRVFGSDFGKHQYCLM